MTKLKNMHVKQKMSSDSDNGLYSDSDSDLGSDYDINDWVLPKCSVIRSGVGVFRNGRDIAIEFYKNQKNEGYELSGDVYMFRMKWAVEIGDIARVFNISLTNRSLYLRENDNHHFRQVYNIKMLTRICELLYDQPKRGKIDIITCDLLELKIHVMYHGIYDEWLKIRSEVEEMQ